MPKKFDDELILLKKKIVTMSDTARDMFNTVMKALVERDADHLNQVPDMEEVVDRHQIEVDEDVTRLMAVYGPVALDLRFVLMVARINTELERIGDQAMNMREHAELLVREPELKKLVDLPRMAETAATMLNNAMTAFNTDDTKLAKEVIKTDDVIDSLYDQIFRELLTYMIADPKNIARSVALIFIARSLERIADHATNIAEEVIYVVKGVDVRHKYLQKNESN